MSVGKARLRLIIRLCLTAIFRLFGVLQNICPPKVAFSSVYYDAKGQSLPVSFVLMPEAINCHDST